LRSILTLTPPASWSTPEHVLDRLASIAATGVDRVVVVPSSLDAEPALTKRSSELFAGEVLPQLLASR
jgi:hypothetical protein